MVTKHLGKVFPRSRGDGSIPLLSAMEDYLGWAEDCFESRTIRKGWGSIPQSSSKIIMR